MIKDLYQTIDRLSGDRLDIVKSALQIFTE
jgi:hypothetical protein